jgi:hypothetical protein
MHRGFTEQQPLQNMLVKGRSNEGVFYYVHWAKLQAHLAATPYDGTSLGVGDERARLARVRCQRQQSVMRIRSFVASGLKRLGCLKDKTTLKYLGAVSFDAVIQHLETKMHTYNAKHPGDTQMSFENVHLDHIKPVQRFALDMNHYTNLQPMFAEANLCKSARWSSADERFWKANIHHNPDFTAIYSAHTPPSTVHRQGSTKERDPVAFALKKYACRVKIASYFGIVPKSSTGAPR